MDKQPNGYHSRIAILAVLVVLAEATTVFSLIYIFFVGLVVMLYNLISRCFQMSKPYFMSGGLGCWAVAICQTVALLKIDETTLAFCQQYDLNDAYCELTLYRVMNAAGAVLWTIAGIVACIIPNPQDDERVLPTITSDVIVGSPTTRSKRKTKPRRTKKTKGKPFKSSCRDSRPRKNNVEWANPIGTEIHVPKEMQDIIV